MGGEEATEMSAVNRVIREPVVNVSRRAVAAG